MNDTKTVSSSSDDTVELTNPLVIKQQEDVAAMRASLLSCTPENPQSYKIALRNITVMRVYHQLGRIIKYTDMMDRIEEKLYESIDHALSNMNSNNPSTWVMLLNIQEKLQKSMIESHKLLQPYLDIEALFDISSPLPTEPSQQDSFASRIYDQQTRDKLRTSAQAVLAAIQTQGPTNEEASKEGQADVE